MLSWELLHRVSNCESVSHRLVLTELLQSKRVVLRGMQRQRTLPRWRDVECAWERACLFDDVMLFEGLYLLFPAALSSRQLLYRLAILSVQCWDVQPKRWRSVTECLLALFKWDLLLDRLRQSGETCALPLQSDMSITSCVCICPYSRPALPVTIVLLLPC